MAKKGKAARKAGRKGKYDEWLAKDGLARLQGWARDGLAEAQIAKNMGIAMSTLSEWKLRFPEIAEAIKKGKAPVDLAVENAMLKAAMGYTYTETVTEKRIGPDGEEIIFTRTVEKQAAPNPTAQIFWLKNRRPERWRDKPKEVAADFADDGLIAALYSGEEDWSNETGNKV